MEEGTGASYTVQKDVDPSNMSNAVLVNTLDGRLFDMLRDSFFVLCFSCNFLPSSLLLPPSLPTQCPLKHAHKVPFCTRDAVDLVRILRVLHPHTARRSGVRDAKLPVRYTQNVNVTFIFGSRTRHPSYVARTLPCPPSPFGRIVQCNRQRCSVHR